MLTMDTMNVVEINKRLVDFYKDFRVGQAYDVKVHKLFAKHIKIKEQAEHLAQKSPNAKVKRCLNIYLSTPGRMSKLVEVGACELAKGDRFRHMVIDMSKNKKAQTIFQQKESAKDTFDVLKACREAFENSCSIMFV